MEAGPAEGPFEIKLALPITITKIITMNHSTKTFVSNAKALSPTPRLYLSLQPSLAVVKKM